MRHHVSTISRLRHFHIPGFSELAVITLNYRNLSLPIKQWQPKEPAVKVSLRESDEEKQEREPPEGG